MQFCIGTIIVFLESFVSTDWRPHAYEKMYLLEDAQFPGAKLRRNLGLEV
jgi:hypothetical protein